MNIAKLQRTKPFMPPFAGNAEEVEALVQWLRWQAREPAARLAADTSDPACLAQIDDLARRSGNGVRALDALRSTAKGFEARLDTACSPSTSPRRLRST